MRCANRYCDPACLECAACTNSPTTPYAYYPELPGRTGLQDFEWRISEDDLNELFASVHALMDKIAVDEALQHTTGRFYYSGASTNIYSGTSPKSSHMLSDIGVAAYSYFQSRKNAVKISSIDRESSECDSVIHRETYQLCSTELDELREACQDLANKIHVDEEVQFERGGFYCSQASTLSGHDSHIIHSSVRSPSPLITAYNLSIDGSDTRTNSRTAYTPSCYHLPSPVQALVDVHHKTYCLVSRLLSRSNSIYENTSVYMPSSASPIQDWGSNYESTSDGSTTGDDIIPLLDTSSSERRFFKLKARLKKWMRRFKSLSTKICR